MPVLPAVDGYKLCNTYNSADDDDDDDDDDAADDNDSYNP